MKAFISYSHNDNNYLDQLHKHLAQLRRDNVLTDWTDNDILPGSAIDDQVIASLRSSDLFLAILTPDYINSGYCYEKEFKLAQELQKSGDLTIVPVIAEPCDWLSTPFQQFKALPKDGKPITDWNNKNTAFLDVVQALRKLIAGSNTVEATLPHHKSAPSRNYKIKKDFDSIQKMDFVEKTFDEVMEGLEKNVAELNDLENIQAKITQKEKEQFTALLVNRNKINTESTLSVTTGRMNSFQNQAFLNAEFVISYSIGAKGRGQADKTYELTNDEYELFWSVANRFHSYGQQQERLSVREIVDTIWTDWLESVGIEF